MTKDIAIQNDTSVHSESKGLSEKEDIPARLTTQESDKNDVLKIFAQHTHSYIRGYISLADQKAVFLFAIGTALLVFLYEKKTTQMWFKSIKLWSLMDAITFIAMFGLSISCVMAIAVVFPRLKGSRRGHLYWGSISEFDSSTEYANSVSKLSEADIVDEILKHNYELSNICKSKYSVLNLSIVFGSIGAVSTILYIIFG